MYKMHLSQIIYKKKTRDKCNKNNKMKINKFLIKPILQIRKLKILKNRRRFLEYSLQIRLLIRNQLKYQINFRDSFKIVKFLQDLNKIRVKYSKFLCKIISKNNRKVNKEFVKNLLVSIFLVDTCIIETE